MIVQFFLTPRIESLLLKWVTGERDLATLNGTAIQVDPFGIREAAIINMTEDGGAWEGK